MPLESSIQASVVKYARQRGLLAKKLSVQGPMGTSGWPDYMFLGPGRLTFFHEYKRLGGKLTPLQEAVCSQICALDHSVEVIDTTEKGRTSIDAHLADPTYSRILRPSRRGR
jgi:hypothetical protein